MPYHHSVDCRVVPLDCRSSRRVPVRVPGADGSVIGRAAPTLLLALTLAACGGGGSSGNSSSSSGASSQASVGLLAAEADTSGTATTFTSAGSIDKSNPFFQPFGNGRSCATCHDQSAGWTVTPALLSQRFDSSNGTDPIFLPVDGANSPAAPVSTLSERRSAYSMLLSKGLIRIGLPIPAGAQFTLSAVDDPYAFASASELSLFRRPLPVANLNFVTAIMWDGRETASDPASSQCVRTSVPLQCYGSTASGLAAQAVNAIMTHAQDAAGLTASQAQQIVAFETALFNAQSTDQAAGNLDANNATGGPLALSQTGFHFGINDLFSGDYETGAPFTSEVMGLYAAWLSSGPPPADATSQARASIARGEQIFNNRRFQIAGVPGFNDVLGQSSVTGTCTSCHLTPNVGDQSVPRFMNTGISAAVRRTPDMPLYTLTNSSTGETIQTMDPGLALQTGQWADIGKVKVPGLRGLQSHPPFFQNGSAPDVAGVIEFYEHRFNLNLAPQEVADLSAFLKAL